MYYPEPDYEKPYIEQGKYEVAVDSLFTRNYQEIWDEFRDEIELEKSLYAYEPSTLLRDIIQLVAEGRGNKGSRLGLYDRIYDKVNDFVNELAEKRTLKHMEAL